MNNGLLFKFVLLSASRVLKPVACFVSKFSISNIPEFVWLFIDGEKPHLFRLMVKAQLPVIDRDVWEKED